MAEVASKPLNPEPSVPEEREALDLPPKSYADAAEEALGDGVPNGYHEQFVNPQQAKKTQMNGVNGDGRTTPGEYSGSGILEGSPSPARGHKRIGSKSSRQNLKINGVKKEEHGKSDDAVEEEEQEKPGEVVKEEEQDKAKDKKDEAEKAEEAKPENGAKESEQRQPEDGLIVEKYRDAEGDRLTSIKPDEDVQESPRTDETMRRRRAQQDRQKDLVSGRQAGAGWDRSRQDWPLSRYRQICSH